jgi:hypothetical protein
MPLPLLLPTSPAPSTFPNSPQTFLPDASAEVSAKFPVPLTPAGWAFSIWGLIFLLEGFGAVYQALDAGYDADGFKARFANATNINWIVSWLAAMGWQFAFVQQVRGGSAGGVRGGHAKNGSGGTRVAPGSPVQHTCPPLFRTCSTCRRLAACGWHSC